MREIKFRVWDKENKCWWQNVYKAYAGELAELHVNLNGDLSMRTIDAMIHESLFPNRFELMQFTGLHDKNGKEIYEGDILNYIPNNTRRTLTGIVEYGKKAAGFKLSGYTRYSIPTNCEVIGNIVESPELCERR